jgi:hypothetical protein
LCQIAQLPIRNGLLDPDRRAKQAQPDKITLELMLLTSHDATRASEFSACHPSKWLVVPSFQDTQTDVSLEYVTIPRML